MDYEFMDPESERQKLWEEAREWAVAEILAKYHKELKEAHSKHFSRLTQRAADVAYCDCKHPWLIYLNNLAMCRNCGNPLRR